ncbi:MAG: secretin N-terminal domain-containing protein [Candidatus Omnitrophota bacterium]
MKRIFSLMLAFILVLSCFFTWTQALSEESSVEGAQRQTEPGRMSESSTAGTNTAPASSEQAVLEEKGPSQEILVDLDIKDADMKDVARALSRISGKNIIVTDDVKAKVAIRVKSMDWQEVLNMILETYGLTMLEKENYIVITTFEKRRAVEESGDLQTKIVRFNFVDVASIQKTLSSMLTKRGRMEIDTRTNSLVITDVSEVLKNIEQVALELDTKTPQVMIEAMMLTVKLNDDEKLGIDWDWLPEYHSERELSQSLGIGGTAGTDYFWQIKYGKTLFSRAAFSATLQFLLEEKRAEILANPRVLTLDNMPANIDLTEQVPYTQQVSSTESTASVTSVQFKDVPVKLIVKPHITKDNFIIMNVQTEQSYLSGYASGTTQPIIDTRKAETNVMVRDGETIVIGGLRKKEKTETVEKFPLLGDIPVVGHFFKKTIKSSVDTELIILITPYVSIDQKVTEREKRRMEEIDSKLLLMHNPYLSDDYSSDDEYFSVEDIEDIEDTEDTEDY